MATQDKDNLAGAKESGRQLPGVEILTKATRRARRNVIGVQHTSMGRRALSVLRNLILVVPLTLLVWLFAQQEEITREPVRVTVSLAARSDRPDRVVALAPSDHTIAFGIKGQTTRVAEAKRDLQREGLVLSVPAETPVGEQVTIPLAEAVSSNKILAERGLTVSDFSPSTVTVFIDELREVEVRPQAPPGIAAMVDGAITFDPPTVKLAGPRSVVANPSKPVQLIAEITPQMLPSVPGPQEISGVPVRLEDSDDRVTITPLTLKAKVQIRSATTTYEHAGIPVFTAGPKPLLDKYSVVYPQGATMARVTLVGPEEEINRIRSGQFNVRAFLEISKDDIQQHLPRTPTYVLPDRVRVSDKDKDRTIDFRLVELSTLQ